MATSSDVERLERETAEARARLAGTLDRLTSPETAQAVKQELTDYAQGLKDQALGYVQSTKESILGTGRDRANGFAGDLKQRALANPLGVALIGAGIGWHLYKKPPITTLLVGAGVAALMAGGGGSPRIDRRAYRDPYDPAQPRGYVPGGVAGYGYPVEEQTPGSSLTDRASGAAAAASSAASAAASRTGEMARDLGTSVRHVASDLTERVSEAVDSATTSVTGAAGTAVTAVGDAAGTAQTTMLDATEAARATVAEAAASARTAVKDMMERTTSTITQTADQAVRQASSLARQAPTNPWVLGAVGLAFGTAIAYSLRSSETGDSRRSDERGSRSPRGGTRGVRSGAGQPARRPTRSEGGSRSGSDFASAASNRLGDVSERASDAASGLASAAAQTVSGVADSAGRLLNAAGETVSSSASGAYEAASSAYRSAADFAAGAGRRAPDAADRVQRQLSELGQRYPLLLGVASLAIGAAVGGSLRLSEGENRLMGPVSDNLKQRARELANEQFGLAREAAEHFAGEIGTQLGGMGQRTDPSADFEEVIGGGKPAVTATSGSAAKSGPDGGSRSPTPSL